MALIEKDKGTKSPEYAEAQKVYEAGIEAGKILQLGGKAIISAITSAKGSLPGSKASLIGQEVRGTGTALAGTNAARVSAEAALKALEVKQAGERPAALVSETTAVQLAQQKALNATASERIDLNKDILGITTTQMVLEKNALDVANLTNDATLTSAQLQATISGLKAQQALDAGKLVKTELEAKEALVTTTKLNAAKVDLQKLQNLEYKGSLALQVSIEQSAARELALVQSKRNLSSELAANSLDIESAILAKKLESGRVTIDQANQEEHAISLTKIRKDTTANLSKAQDELNTLTDRFNRKSLDIDASGLQDLSSEYDRNSAILRNNIIIIEQKGLTSLKVAEISKKNSEKETAYANLFNNSVTSMSDALVDFAFTGKQSFGDMINSMLMDLVKLEMRMLAVKAIQQSGGASSITSNLISAGISYFTGPSGGVGTGNAFGNQDLGAFLAKGGAYDSGVQAFAKGGTFTNSVVSSPTLFKFAKGTGMMGEAGPEAIMPLKRNANGVLGVEGGASGGGETNVIINNYGPSKTETKKTIDSRGNKTIEVIIGDAVAGEIRRSGSPAQESIKSTFGRQPQLIRR